MPERPVIIVLYGTPGSGKTSLACTSEKPLLIDTDRGYDRACTRVDTLTASNWNDIFNVEIVGDRNGTKGAISEYKTIIVDTAKSMIDDFLSAHVISQNYKLATNSLKRYGEMGEQFKNFVNILRSNGSDIIFVCHDKETTEGDIIKHSPDCTGQSKDLLVRIADQVGYVCMQNGKRIIKFQPVDTRVGKNVAQFDDIWIPEFGTDAFKTCMADIIKRVKEAIQSRSEAQVEALAKLDAARKQLDEVSDVDAANALIEVSNGLAKIHQKAFKTLMISELAKKGYTFNTDTKKFEYNEPAA